MLGTSTLRTEENVDRFIDIVEETVENPNSIWFEEGTQLAGTDREVESINTYDDKKNRIAVFKRSTGEFITFCESVDDEIEDLFETENFAREYRFFSGQARNVPLKAKSE